MFPDERTCRMYWKEKREMAGIKCKRCESGDHYWHSGKYEWRCKKCNSSTSLRSGTVMRDSNLPFLTWFTAMYEMMFRTKSLSSTEMYGKLDVKSEGTAWYLMHKIRLAMGLRDEKYKMDGNVEMDDAFITVVKSMKLGNKTKSKESPGKRGRGAERKATILVMASSEPVKKKRKNRPGTFPKYFKMIVAEDLTKGTVNGLVRRYVKLRSRVKTDGYRCYSDLKIFMKEHIRKVIPANQAHIELPWAHVCIGNFKRYIDGIHHHISDEYLQNYLDEFVYKLNRRNFKSPFENIVNATLQKVWG